MKCAREGGSDAGRDAGGRRRTVVGDPVENRRGLSEPDLRLRGLGGKAPGEPRRHVGVEPDRHLAVEHLAGGPRADERRASKPVIILQNRS